MRRSKEESRHGSARNRRNNTGANSKPGCGDGNGKEEGEIRNHLVADERIEQQTRGESDCNESERQCVSLNVRSYAPDSLSGIQTRHG